MAKILCHGRGRAAGAMLMPGLIGILTRLRQLGFALGEVGWDRNCLGVVIGEMANAITWSWSPWPGMAA